MIVKATLQRHLVYATVATLLATALTALHLKAQRDQARAELADQLRLVAEATLKEAEKARATETQLRHQAEQLRTQLAQEKHRAQVHQDRLVADVRSGAQRLSIAARCPAPPGTAPTDPGAATGDGPSPPRAELDREAAAALVAIAADGDTAIRERNACIQQYNDVRARLNPGTLINEGTRPDVSLIDEGKTELAAD